MMKYLTLPLLALLAACQASPEEGYIATLNMATVTLDGAAAYAEDCALYKPEGHPCEGVVEDLESPIQLLKDAKDQASKVIVTGESPYYEINKSILENAISNVKRVLKGGSNE